MNDDIQNELNHAREIISSLQEELAETNRGLIALTAELDRKNEELRNAVQQMWNTAKLATMGELSASIAHEINNPLAIISLWIEALMNDTPHDDPRLHAITIIDEECTRMSTLITNLLQFTRCSGRQVSTIDITCEIDLSLELINYHLRKYGHQVHADYRTRTQVLADRQQMRQVFLNLFTNASDAMQRSGVISIETNTINRTCIDAMIEEKKIFVYSDIKTASGQTEWLNVCIADTGPGIEDNILPRIADSFFSTKEPGKGTGLGLPICRRIIQEHEGIFAVDCKRQEGAAFHIFLPLNGIFEKENNT